MSFTDSTWLQVCVRHSWRQFYKICLVRNAQALCWRSSMGYSKRLLFQNSIVSIEPASSRSVYQLIAREFGTVWISVLWQPVGQIWRPGCSDVPSLKSQYSSSGAVEIWSHNHRGCDVTSISIDIELGSSLRTCAFCNLELLLARVYQGFNHVRWCENRVWCESITTFAVKFLGAPGGKF